LNNTTIWFLIECSVSVNVVLDIFRNMSWKLLITRRRELDMNHAKEIRKDKGLRKMRLIVR